MGIKQYILNQSTIRDKDIYFSKEQLEWLNSKFPLTNSNKPEDLLISKGNREVLVLIASKVVS